MTALVSVSNLHKHFGQLHAVRGISFDLKPGEVLGFLGPNGAGKTTTMRMITGYLSADDGEVSINGRTLARDGAAYQHQFGYLPEGGPLYPEMTPRQFLHFIGDVRGLSAERFRERLDYVTSHLHLEPVLDRPIETLSKGYRRRVGLAQAILHDPTVLILDEPTDGLDPNQKHEVRRLIRRMAPGKAIIISTHILEEVDALCSRAMIIANGEVVADSTPEALVMDKKVEQTVIAVIRPMSETDIDSGSLHDSELSLVEMVDPVRNQLLDVPDVAQVDVVLQGDVFHCRITPASGATVTGSINHALMEADMEIIELRTERARLEDVFRHLTHSGGKGGAQ